ncbi:MAG: OmpA family protein [Proteobacteria bacterium]|nr:OmpA family protein [Pseudomonadota bacterium]MBU1688707.1 OmpA family protein [Pseudomonadota bacterium]
MIPAEENLSPPEIEGTPPDRAETPAEGGQGVPGNGFSSGEALRGIAEPLRVYQDEDILRQPFRPRGTHWSVAWSDLMMTMFIFFAVLYIYQLENRGLHENWQPPSPGSGSGLVGAGPGGSVGGNLSAEDAIINRSREVIRAGRLEDVAEVTLTPDETVRFTLANDLLFGSGEAVLRQEARSVLSGLAEILRQTPYAINVVGHTDSLPIHTDRFSSNWELSVLRATAVARFLMDEAHLPQQRFFVTGHAASEPLRPNDTEANRAVNRRVEIILMKDKP